MDEAATPELDEEKSNCKTEKSSRNQLFQTSSIKNEIFKWIICLTKIQLAKTRLSNFWVVRCCRGPRNTPHGLHPFAVLSQHLHSLHSMSHRSLLGIAGSPLYHARYPFCLAWGPGSPWDTQVQASSASPSRVGSGNRSQRKEGSQGTLADSWGSNSQTRSLGAAWGLHATIWTALV